MENLRETIHVRLPTELHEQLARLADAEERPVSWWVRRALRDLVQSQATPRRSEEAA